MRELGVLVTSLIWSFRHLIGKSDGIRFDGKQERKRRRLVSPPWTSKRTMHAYEGLIRSVTACLSYSVCWTIFLTSCCCFDSSCPSHAGPVQGVQGIVHFPGSAGVTLWRHGPWVLGLAAAPPRVFADPSTQMVPSWHLVIQGVHQTFCDRTALFHRDPALGVFPENFGSGVRRS